MAQAHEARDRLAAAHGLAPGAIEIVSVRASGDRVQDRPLAEIGGKALWTKELDAWLIAGEIDLAVHSAKDVETIRPSAITMAAVLPREDVRDVLIGASSIAALPPGAVVGTSAPRRAAQLLYHRPDCRAVPIRGNVDTRLAKLAAGEVDATFLAAAGLNRLGKGGTGHSLSENEWLPAPGQAAIAIECRANDAATKGQNHHFVDDRFAHVSGRKTQREEGLEFMGALFEPELKQQRHQQQRRDDEEKAEAEK